MQKTIEELQQLHGDIVKKVAEDEAEKLPLLRQNLSDARVAADLAKHQLEKVEKAHEKAIRTFNYERLWLFLQLQTENGQFWDSFDREFKAGEKYYYLLLQRNPRQIDYDDIVYTLELYLTPDRDLWEAKPEVCFDEFLMPVIWEGNPPNPVKTAADLTANHIYASHNFSPTAYTVTHDIAFHQWMIPRSVPEELAESYGLPPGIVK